MRSVLGIVVSGLMGAALMLPAPADAGVGRQAGADAEGSELHCLALNIYFEARGEPLAGKLAVGHVVLNRAASKRFPKRICAVVQQGGDKRRHRCQFSWWCDGQSDRPRNRRAWQEALFVAKMIKGGMTQDPTRGARWYHAVYVSPDWSQDFAPTEQVKIGRHIFYGADAAAETRLAGRVCRAESDWTWTA